MKLILTILVCIYASIAHALVLEDLVKDGKLVRWSLFARQFLHEFRDIISLIKIL